MSSVRRWLGGRSTQVSPTVLPDPASPARAELDPRVGVMLAEWQEILASLRACARQRLAQLTVFLAAAALTATAYLPLATAPAGLRHIARWMLPALGALLGVVFLILEIGLSAYRHELARRARQIETAIQILLPDIGHVRALALLTDFDPETSAWVRMATWIIAALYGLILLAWMVALLATAVGSAS
ncbi:MAG TPA: hypothetical protein VMD03_05055 [Steroidobacteraceae bacterium]|nr:hypothetical protein [Steroidobacteraceae bacterium]